jgi:hypothetical protein
MNLLINMSNRMYTKLKLGVVAVSGILILGSCFSEPNHHPQKIDQANVTFSEVRNDIKVSGQTFKKDLEQRLQVLDIFFEDVMDAYHTADQQRRQELKPKVEQVKRLSSRVRGQIDAYQPGKEQLSEHQREQIIENMQALREGYHDLVSRLGITWK